jgi:molybdopterin-guanine dinucleotide biosynthesis protein A
MQDTFGLVLAGGLASRMEGEKPLRVLGGKTLLEIALSALRPLCVELAVSTGQRELVLPKGIEGLPDLKPHVMQGPLSGIWAGLKAAQKSGAEIMLVLACDLPHISAALLMKLAQELKGHDVVFCEHGGQPEPLVCALRVTPMLATVEAALEKGALKVVPLWKAANCRLLVDADIGEFAPLERMFANINTLEDLSNETQSA